MTAKHPAKVDLSARKLQIQQVLQWFKNSDYKRDDGKLTLQKADLLKSFSNFRRDYSEDDRHVMVSAYGKIARVLEDMWTYINAKDNPAMLQSYAVLLETLGAIAEFSGSYCHHIARHGIIQLFIIDLNSPNFLDIRKVHQQGDAVRKKIALLYVSIMHSVINVHGVANGANSIRQANGVGILRQYVDTSDDYLKLQTLFVLGAVVNDEEQEKLSSLIQDSTVALIVRHLQDAQQKKDSDRLRKLLSDLCMMANFSERFVDLLLQQGILPIFEQIMADSKYSADERHLAAKCCWSFTFYQVGRDAIKANGAIMAAFQRASDKGNSEDFSRTCSGVLWSIEATDKKSNDVPVVERSETLFVNELMPKEPAQRDKPPQSLKSDAPVVPSQSESNASQGHIMLSYSWTSQQDVIRINNYLKSRNIRTWLDVTDMRGSTVAAMAAAVENAAAVIICFSQAYFQSANCRAEAEYAFNLKKHIIPARMENYKPSGWLGLILGVKLYYDFAEQSAFNDGVSRLLNALQTVVNVDLQSVNSLPVLPVDVVAMEDPFSSPSRPMSALSKRAPSPRRKTDESALSALREKLQSWTPAEVQSWLKLCGLAKHAAKFADYDGEAILGMIIIESRTPNVLYDSLRQDLRLDLLGLTRFVSALNKLSTNPEEALGIEVP